MNYDVGRLLKDGNLLYLILARMNLTAQELRRAGIEGYGFNTPIAYRSLCV